MAAVKGYKSIDNWTNELQIMRLVYDFALDAGAQATLDLAVAPNGMVIHSAYANVKTACTSGGSATVSVGVDTDVDAVIDETAVASLTAGALIAPVTNNPVLVAATKKVNLTIATADLTAGKIEVVLVVSKF